MPLHPGDGGFKIAFVAVFGTPSLICALVALLGTTPARTSSLPRTRRSSAWCCSARTWSLAMRGTTQVRSRAGTSSAANTKKMQRRLG